MDNNNKQQLDQKPQSEDSFEDDEGSWVDGSSDEDQSVGLNQEQQQKKIIQQIIQNTPEETKTDPSWKKLDEIKHCQHYIRWCEKQAPCCKIFYPCRICHNEKYQGPKSPGCKVETMERQKITVIRCKRCLTEQSPSNKCINCDIIFAKYYCKICKLYDDDPTKEIFHCEKCNMCRKGIQNEHFHCDKCAICLPIIIQKSHQCKEEAFVQNCSICMENLKESRTGVIQLQICKHWIHQDCLNQYLMKSPDQRCPLCNTPLKFMSKYEIEYYDQLAKLTLQQFPKEVRDMKVSILCLECHQETKDIGFNFYLKCQNCGSYNTKR